MAKTTTSDYCYQVEFVCHTNATRPPHHLAHIKNRSSKRAHSLFAFIIITLTIVTQKPQHCTAAVLKQQANTELGSLEFGGDALNLLHELTRFIHQDEKIGAAEDVGNDHGHLERHLRRLHKRHNRVEQSGAIGSDDEPEWQNVCGRSSGWSGDELPENHDNHDYIQLYIKNLRKSVRLEYKVLKTNGFHDINIDDMKAWRRHERKYKFLPTLDHNSAIAPICWHEGIQKFIASFVYLYKTQQHWDKQHLRTQSSIARELHELLQSSKRMLCEIETTAKGSYPRDKLQFTTFTRNEMSANLKFYTRNAEESALHGQRGVNHTDLRFAKFFYQNYLLRIWKLLLQHGTNIQLQNSCDKRTHPTILDKSLDNEASIMNSEMDDDDDNDEE